MIATAWHGMESPRGCTSPNRTGAHHRGTRIGHRVAIGNRVLWNSREHPGEMLFGRMNCRELVMMPRLTA